MSATDVVIGLVFLALFLLPALKKILEAAGEQGREAGRQRPQGQFEASPADIRDFLESIASGRQPGREARAEAEGAAGPGEARAGGGQPPPVPRRQPPRAVSRRSSRRSPGMQRAERRLARARKEAAAVAPAAAPSREVRSAVGPPPQRRRAAQAAASGEFSLKRAVVWSEILRPPVSLRRSHHHVPPAAER